MGMSKASQKKPDGSKAATGKRGTRARRGELGRVKILAPAVKLGRGEAEAIRRAVRNYYKRVKILEQV
jgi:hypothetical protein